MCYHGVIYDAFIETTHVTFVQLLLALLAALVMHELSARFVGRVVRRLVRRNRFETLIDEMKRENTLITIASASLQALIWIVVIAVMLHILSIDLASVAAGAGFLGIIIGLGAQTTIRDYLAGMFILAENQYRVGDIITLRGGSTGNGTSGVVEDISLRITKLRDLDGTLSSVRNGEATIVTNRTISFSSVLIDIGVSYDSNIDKVEEVLNKIGQDMLTDEELAKNIKEPIAFLRVDGFGASAIMIKVVGKVVPAKQWEIAGEYRRRVLKAFRTAKIEIAYPQLDVHQK
ncbi:MAG: mechanosensitive ion channel domain-containing protein [Candidatus Saccharimonadales bacterium]